MAKKKAQKKNLQSNVRKDVSVTTTDQPVTTTTMAPAAEVTTTAVASDSSVATITPSKTKSFIGAWAYMIGMLLALVASIWNPSGLDYVTISALALLGFVVGVLNISDDEVLVFLVATLAFIVSASSMRLVLQDVVFIQTFMNAIIIFTAVSAFVVSFKAIFHVAKSV